MSFDPNVLHRATKRLAQRRAQREANQDAIRAEIHQKLPRTAQIDQQLRRTIAGIIAASLREGDDPSPPSPR